MNISDMKGYGRLAADGRARHSVREARMFWCAEDCPPYVHPVFQLKRVHKPGFQHLNGLTA